jgi:UDP-hydrolysing UDP-N-acetyl-D-glucosamine 2-epimerase
MLADLHFPGNDESAKRIEKMRGSKEYIYNVGEPGLDSIVAQDIVNRTTLSSDLGLDLDKPWYLITIHPETMKDKNYNLNLASNIIKALKQISNSQFVITSANADLYGNEINNYLKKIAQENSESFFFIYSLGHKKYISMINQVVCLIGNSSSGIVEAPILGKPVINIGGRQKGRHLCHNIINASNDAESILTAIKKIHGKYSPDYYYGDGHTCEKIADYILKFLYR